VFKVRVIEAQEAIPSGRFHHADNQGRFCISAGSLEMMIGRADRIGADLGLVWGPADGQNFDLAYRSHFSVPQLS
jgi:hypothetical protein